MSRFSGFRAIGLALVLSLFVFTSAAEAKIAAASFGQIVQESEMGKAANKLIESQMGSDMKKLEADKTKFQKDAQDFQKQAAALSDSARAQKAQDLEKRMIALQTTEQNLAKKFAPTQKKINETIAKILQEATETVAKSEKLDIILDAAPPVYFVADSINIQSKVLSEVNKIWKKQGGRFKL